MNKIIKDMEMIIGKYLHELEGATCLAPYTRKEVHDYIRARCTNWQVDGDIGHWNVQWVDQYKVFVEFLDVNSDYHTITKAFDVFKGGANVTTTDPITDYDRAMRGV